MSPVSEFENPSGAAFDVFWGGLQILDERDRDRDRDRQREVDGSSTNNAPLSASRKILDPDNMYKPQKNSQKAFIVLYVGCFGSLYPFNNPGNRYLKGQNHFLENLTQR